ncbi:hypothetical protein, partial [Streptomyces triticirhizae]
AADLHGLRALDASLAGEPATARALAARAVAAAETTDSPLTRATAHLDLARVQLAADLPARAVASAGEAVRLYAAKGHRVGRDTTISLLAHAASRLDPRARRTAAGGRPARSGGGER